MDLTPAKLTPAQFEQLAHFSHNFKQCYATSKFDVGKIKIELNLPLKAAAVFKKQRANRIILQLQNRVQHLLDILAHFDIIAPFNIDSLATGNTFINAVIILRKKETPKIVLVARLLNRVIHETKCSWPREPI